MTLDRTSAVKNSLGFYVGLVGKLFGVKLPENNCLTSGFNARSPFSVLSLVSAKQARFVVDFCCALVFRVLALRYISQVCNAIVSLVSVSVVYHVVRKFAVYIKPRESVRLIPIVINRKFYIPAIVTPASYATGLDVSTALREVRKDSGFWVVVQQFAQTIRGKLTLFNFRHWQFRIVEIVYPVVASVFVFPVDTKSWQFAVHIKPSKVRGFVMASVNGYANAPIKRVFFGNIPSKGLSAPSESGKYSGQRIVVKQLFESSLREFRIGCSCHLKSLSMMVRSPFGVSSPSGLRYFSGYTPAMQG